MAAPVLTYSVETSSGINKLSLTPPYDECLVKFSCDQAYSRFRCMITYGDAPWGKDVGLEVVEFENRPAEVELNFKIFARNHLVEGEGTYRVSFYLLDTNDRWHYTGFYLKVVSAGGGYIAFKTSDDKYVDMSVNNMVQRVILTDGMKLKTSMKQYYNVQKE